jgi:hypothetical protein
MIWRARNCSKGVSKGEKTDLEAGLRIGEEELVKGL